MKRFLATAAENHWVRKSVHGFPQGLESEGISHLSHFWKEALVVAGAVGVGGHILGLTTETSGREAKRSWRQERPACMPWGSSCSWGYNSVCVRETVTSSSASFH